jgi:hypothetical protein
MKRLDDEAIGDLMGEVVFRVGRETHSGAVALLCVSVPCAARRGGAEGEIHADVMGQSRVEIVPPLRRVLVRPVVEHLRAMADRLEAKADAEEVAGDEMARVISGARPVGGS